MGPTFDVTSTCTTDNVISSEIVITDERKIQPVQSAVTTSHTIKDRTAVIDKNLNDEVVAWQTTFMESISKMKRAEYTHPLQSMCLFECIKNTSRIQSLNTSNPANICTLHAFERQSELGDDERMIMVNDSYNVFHFSYETIAIPKLLQSSIAPFRNINQGPNLIQEKSDMIAFCSKGLDITYDLSSSPLF